MSESISRVLTSFLSALSVTVALGLAFALDMEKPFWAGFAALVVSLSTVGQSLEKGLLRMAGTVAGAVIAMSLLSLFGDARWTLMLSVGAMLVILELCMEMSRYSSYFYYTTALVILLVVAQSHGEAPFFVAASRVEENMLGIAVYTVCALLLWPRSSLDSLHATKKGASPCD